MKRRVYNIKYLAAILIASLMSYAAPANVSAACDNTGAHFSMVFSQVVFGVGDTFYVDIILNNGECVQAVAISLDYDDTKLSFVSASTVDMVDGGIFPNPSMLVPAAPPGIISRDVANLGAPVGDDVDPVTGAVMRVHFEALDEGVTSIDFHVGLDGLHPRISENDNNVFTYYDNVNAIDKSLLIVVLMDVPRLVDDFNDGDFTNNPTWYASGVMPDLAFEMEDLGGGNFAVCLNDTYDEGTIMALSTSFNHWKFSFMFNTPGPDFHTGAILTSDRFVGRVTDEFIGYYFSINQGDGAIYRKDGETGFGTALGDAVPVSSGASIQIVRDDNGTFYLFESDDTDFTVVDWSAINFLGVFEEEDPGVFSSVFSGFFFENQFGLDNMCFDNVDHGIPAAVLQGTPGQTNAHLLASPMEDTSYNDLLATVFTQGYPGSDLPVATSNVYVFDETVSPKQPVLGGSYLPPNAGTNRVGTRSDVESSAGKGALFYIFDEVNYQGVYAGWPKVLEFDGTPNTGDVNVPLSLTFTGSGLYDSYDDGWHIAGNPYMRSLSAQELLEHSLGMHNAVYVWDQSMNGGQGYYRFYVLDTGGTLPGGLIAPFQGFWVKANEQGSSELRFTESQQVSGDGGTLHDAPAVRAITFSAKSGDIESTMMVAFNPKSQTGTDSFDAFKLPNGNAQYLSMFTRNTDGHQLLVNSLPAEITQELRIPVYLNSNFANAATISIDGIEAFDSSWTFELIDNRSGDTHDLSSISGDISLPPNHLNRNPSGNNALIGGQQTYGSPAFTLVINSPESAGTELPEQVTLRQNYPNPFNPTTNITFTVPEQMNINVSVYDLMGRRVATLMNEQKSAGQYTITWDASALSSGVYIYRIQAGNVALSRKMTLIK